MFEFIIEAALVEGMLAEEVDSGEGETTLAHAALHHLKDLSTGCVQIIITYIQCSACAGMCMCVFVCVHVAVWIDIYMYMSCGT